MANVGVIPYEDKGDVGNKKPEDLSKCKLVMKGDFVINTMNYGIGSYGVSDYDGVCSPVYIVLTPLSDVVEPRFAFRIFENRAFQTYAQSFGNGILEHRCAINWDILKSIGVPVPPQEEQRDILLFLDREAARIDALVAEQRRLMELLKEKRQAVISHAVTKGLNLHAPMKDSGIEWLGEVPVHWEVGALKRFWTVIDCKHVTAEFVDDGIPVASIREVQGWWVELKNAKRTTEQYYNQLSEGGRIPQPGDLIFSRNATVGEVAQVHADHPRFAIGQDVVLLRRRSAEYSADYLQHVLRSAVITNQLANLMIGSTFKRINVQEICSLLAPFPPSEEQAMIAKYLEREVNQLDRLCEEVQRGIDLLLERRATLISSAVTGQIDVRNVKERRSAA